MDLASRVQRVASIMSEKESIVITGCGWVTPFAIGNTEGILSAACTGSGRAGVTNSHQSVLVSELDRYSEASKELRSDKTAWMAAVAWDAAFKDASLDPSTINGNRLGLVMGCALAGQQSMVNFADEVRQQSARFVSPIHFPHTVGNYAAGALARAKGIRGPNVTFASGIQTSLRAVIEGFLLLDEGAADVIACGGCDALSREMAVAFGQPDTTLSECACFVTLERVDHARRRNARILAVVSGFEGISGQAESESDRRVCVTASVTSPAEGDITVEPWLGHCGGALGAATVATAIATARGSIPADLPGTYPAPPATDMASGGGGTGSHVVIRDNGLHPTLSLVLEVPRADARPVPC